MKPRAKFFISLVIAAPLLFGALVWLAGSVLSHSVNRSVGALPSDVTGRNVTFPSASGATIHGWWIDGAKGKGAIILMHGVRDSRVNMLARARFLSAAGYSVLLFDFQAHGASLGEQITFGYLESRDAQAAVKFVRAALPGENIGILGVSLGGAATLLAEPKIDVNAIAIEMVYPTIQQAIDNRMRHYLGFVGGWLTPLFVAQLEPRLGIAPEVLQPINKIGNLTMPKLIIAASEDNHTPLNESQALFNAAQESKELWVVQGAAHENLHRFAKAEYERRVLEFLARTLR